MGIRGLYDRGLPEGVKELGFPSFCALVVFSYLTGAGGNGGLTSSVNSTAKSFPDHMRGITTGIVISGFGLSAFLFSTISRSFFAGNTSAFLLILAVGTAAPMILGLFLVRPILLPPHESKANTVDYDAVSDRHDDDLLTTLERNDSHSPLLSGSREDEEELLQHRGYVGESGVSPERAPRDMDVELSPRPSARSIGHARSLSRGTALIHDVQPNLYGWKLWKSGDFYLLFAILSLLSGTGIMYINNVGAMSQALYAYNNPNYDPIEAARWQSTQVSSISLMNCAGRIIIGFISDLLKARWSIPRSYSLVLVSIICCFSQALVLGIDEIQDLSFASSVLGLGYGAVFSLLPNVCMEWFGLTHFSENWGYLSMSPAISGNVFSLIFGINLDRNDDGNSPAPSTPKSVRSGAIQLLRRSAGSTTAPGNGIRCSKGQDCYVESIYVTLGATLLAIVLSVWAGWRDRKKIQNAMRKRAVLTRGGVENEY